MLNVSYPSSPVFHITLTLVLPMPGLLDLSPELLDLILEEIGGHELRRDKNRLLVCRKWYASAKPVFLSGIDLATVREYGCTILQRKEGWWHSSTERKLMQKNTRSFHVRLRGHWWDEVTKQNHDKFETFDYDTLCEPNVSPLGYPLVAAGHNDRMLEWRDTTDKKLKALSADFSTFEQLEDFMQQVGFDTEEAFGKPWRYFHASALERLLVSLPLITALNTLTLDLYAALVEDTSSCIETNSLCTRIAAILPLVPKVRLRLRKSCAAVFKISDNLGFERIRLKSLAIKLHMPYHYHNQGDTAGPWWCHDDQYPRREQHFNEMVKGAQAFLQALAGLRSAGDSSSTKPTSTSKNVQKKVAHKPGKGKSHTGTSTRTPPTHGLDLLRMSWPGSSGSTNIYSVDIISGRIIMPPEELFIYEDDGEDCWDLEERKDLRDCGPL